MVRDDLGLTQDELAAKAGVSRSIVQSIERPVASRSAKYRAPSRRKVLMVARVLGIESELNAIPSNKSATSYPLQARVSASGWVDSIPEGEIRFIEFTGERHDGAYVLEIMGDSMSPKYLPGDLVLMVPVWETTDLQPGDDIAVHCDGNEHEGKATFKKIVDVRDGVLILEPINKSFKALAVECGHVSRAARAVSIQRRVGR